MREQQAPNPVEKLSMVRNMFLAAAYEMSKRTGFDIRVAVNGPDEATDTPTDGAEVATASSNLTGDDAPEMVLPRFNIGDVVCLRSGGIAMNVSDTNPCYAVVRCIWTDEEGNFCEQVIPESCLNLYQEGSN